MSLSKTKNSYLHVIISINQVKIIQCIKKYTKKIIQRIKTPKIYIKIIQKQYYIRKNPGFFDLAIIRGCYNQDYENDYRIQDAIDMLKKWYGMVVITKNRRLF